MLLLLAYRETPPKSEADFGGRSALPTRSSTLPRPSSQASLTAAATAAAAAATGASTVAGNGDGSSLYTSHYSRSRKLFDKGPSLVRYYSMYTIYKVRPARGI